MGNKCNSWPLEGAIIICESLLQVKGQGLSRTHGVTLGVCPPVLSCPAVEFPCGRQQNEAIYRVRSLMRDSLQDKSSDTASNGTSPVRNITDSGTNSTQEEEQLGLDVTDVEAGGNETQLWEEDIDTRIVGGLLQKRGGSPWQVWRTFSVESKHYSYIMFIFAAQECNLYGQKLSSVSLYLSKCLPFAATFSKEKQCQ